MFELRDELKLFFLFQKKLEYNNDEWMRRLAHCLEIFVNKLSLKMQGKNKHNTILRYFGSFHEQT